MGITLEWNVPPERREPREPRGSNDPNGQEGRRAGVAVLEILRGDGGGGRGGARDFKYAVVVEVVAVKEAGRGVGCRGIEGAGKADGGHAARTLIDRPVVAQGRGGCDVVDGDDAPIL